MTVDVDALPLRAEQLTECVACGCIAGLRCKACGAALCDYRCAADHGLEVHGVRRRLPRVTADRRPR